VDGGGGLQVCLNTFEQSYLQCPELTLVVNRSNNEMMWTSQIDYGPAQMMN